MGVIFAPNKRMAIQQAKRIAREENREYVEPTLAKRQIKHPKGWKTWRSGAGRKKRIKEGRIIHPNWRTGGKYEAAYDPYSQGKEAYFNTYAAAIDFLRKNGVDYAWYMAPTGKTKKVNVNRAKR